MKYEEISKAILQGEKIYNLPLRVCYYCRVSTDSDVQLNSLDNQVKYYENYIKTKDNWTFVCGYFDEGKSGVRVDIRAGFKRMINDAKMNKFDLIVTKEVSRFARDLEDSIHYIRELKNSGVGVFFENQNLNSFDSNSELILNIMFNLAQEESKKISSRVKFGHKQSIEKGHVLGSSNITGYKKEKCKLIIVEKEAKFIKTLFELYSSGKYGFQKLSKKLSTLGYLNSNGKLYDKESLKRMIENPKYKGYYRAKTYEILDYRTKKRKKNNIDDQIIYKCKKDIIPAIVSEELWNKANQILNIRTKEYKNNNHYSRSIKYPLSSKIYCKEHNQTFQRGHGSKQKRNPTWSCGQYLQYRLEHCASPIIKEIDLYNILSKVMHTVINASVIVNNMLELYKNLDITKEYNNDLKNINKSIENIENKKTMALELILNGDINKDSLKKQFKKYDQEINELNLKKIDIIKHRKRFNSNFLNQLKPLIEEEINSGLLDGFIRQFVDEIIVSKINNNRRNIKLDIYLDLLSQNKAKIKGAKHINCNNECENVYLKKQTYCTIDKLKSITYDVYEISCNKMQHMIN